MPRSMRTRSFPNSTPICGLRAPPTVIPLTIKINTRLRSGYSRGIVIDLQIKLLDKDLPMPRYQHPGDAGLDLPSRIECILEPGERAMVPTGIAVAIPEGYCGFVMIR